ncbi:MAG: TatD family hydrolase [Oligoflexia bacterium]|nr:TatD family hydrolase [Oligoflexia bacterium]
MRWIDAHCHLSDLRFEGRHGEVFAAAAQAGVGAFIMGGVEPAEWARQRELARQSPRRIFPVYGIHPWFVDAHFNLGRAELEAALSALPDWIAGPECVGAGEMGLDHGKKRNPGSRPLQREVFERQITIALAAKKPLVLHVVHAHEEAIECLRAQGPYPHGGLVHAFSGSAETAMRYLELGFTISVGGAVAQEKGYETLKRAVQKLPADRLVIETDCPAFGLEDPGCLPIFAKALGKLRKESAESLLETSRQNLIQMFDLEPRLG